MGWQSSSSSAGLRPDAASFSPQRRSASNFQQEPVQQQNQGDNRMRASPYAVLQAPNLPYYANPPQQAATEFYGYGFNAGAMADSFHFSRAAAGVVPGQNFMPVLTNGPDFRLQSSIEGAARYPPRQGHFRTGHPSAGAVASLQTINETYGQSSSQLAMDRLLQDTQTTGDPTWMFTNLQNPSLPSRAPSLVPGRPGSQGGSQYSCSHSDCCKRFDTQSQLRYDLLPTNVWPQELTPSIVSIAEITCPKKTVHLYAPYAILAFYGQRTSKDTLLAKRIAEKRRLSMQRLTFRKAAFRP